MSAKPQPLDFVARTAAASGAMAASQRVEMALTHRPENELPVRVVEALIGRGLPTGAQAVAGQFAQAILAALALGFAKVAHRIPIVPTIALDVLCCCILDERRGSAGSRTGRHAMEMVRWRTSPPTSPTRPLWPSPQQSWAGAERTAR